MWISQDECVLLLRLWNNPPLGSKANKANLLRRKKKYLLVPNLCKKEFLGRAALDLLDGFSRTKCSRDSSDCSSFSGPYWFPPHLERFHVRKIIFSLNENSKTRFQYYNCSQESKWYYAPFWKGDWAKITSGNVTNVSQQKGVISALIWLWPVTQVARAGSLWHEPPVKFTDWLRALAENICLLSCRQLHVVMFL